MLCNLRLHQPGVLVRLKSLQERYDAGTFFSSHGSLRCSIFTLSTPIVAIRVVPVMPVVASSDAIRYVHLTNNAQSRCMASYKPPWDLIFTDFTQTGADFNRSKNTDLLVVTA